MEAFVECVSFVSLFKSAIKWSEVNWLNNKNGLQIVSDDNAHEYLSNIGSHTWIKFEELMNMFTALYTFKKCIGEWRMNYNIN